MPETATSDFALLVSVEKAYHVEMLVVSTEIHHKRYGSPNKSPARDASSSLQRNLWCPWDSRTEYECYGAVCRIVWGFRREPGSVIHYHTPYKCCILESETTILSHNT